MNFTVANGPEKRMGTRPAGRVINFAKNKKGPGFLDFQMRDSVTTLVYSPQADMLYSQAKLLN
jgi:hypothetical protein